MPGHFLPRKSGAHRIACIALYRGLLQLCSRITLPSEILENRTVNPLKHFIRKKFKQNKDVTSRPMVVGALEAGYATHKFLTLAANSNTAAESQLYTLLKTLQRDSHQASIDTPKPPKRIRQPRAVPHPLSKPVLEIRPLPFEQLTGRRHIPTLVFTSAQRLAFLKFKRPQSPYLSRVLRQKDRTRLRRHEITDEIGGAMEEAALEAEWEDLIERQMEEEDCDEVLPDDWGDKESWMVDLRMVKLEFAGRTKREFKRMYSVGKRLIEIVEEEERLWRVEREMRKNEKNEAKWVVKKERWMREMEGLNDGKIVLNKEMEGLSEDKREKGNRTKDM